MGLTGRADEDLSVVRGKARLADSKKTMKVPDYTMSSERLSLKVRQPREKSKHGEHPLETMAKAERARNDAFGRLKENQVLITNLPSVETPELATEQTVREFLIAKVHKDLQVKDIEFV